MEEENEKLQKPVEAIIIGAGHRGMYIYGELSKREDINLKIVGVAEPIDERREKMKQEHNIPSYRCFKSGEEALKQPKFCDAVINSTSDKEHYKISIDALEKGYHLLLEKPMATSPKECAEIVKAQEKAGTVLSVSHVLRYTPFFQEVKKLLSTKEFGKIVGIDLIEEVAYWHFAHSFVRGNWRKKSESGPVILTKSCHDMDILTWLTDSDVDSLNSNGSLRYFNKENAPKGSTPRCTGKCKIKKTCSFNAEKLYLSTKEPNEVIWPTSVISPVDKSLVARKKALKEGPYGRCVYRCDNDVCDNQEVSINFSNGIKVRFTLTAFGSDPTRKLKIYLEGGEIHGDLTKGSLIVIRYKGIRRGDDVKSIDLSIKDHHGGGDGSLLKNFVRAISEQDQRSNLTTAQMSLQGHLMAFAAEESRLKGRPINFKNYKRRVGLKA